MANPPNTKPQVPTDAVAAFRVFLGRDPHPDKTPPFDNIHELNRGLQKSKEFQASQRSVKEPLGWPLSQVFVSRAAKVLYCPIGKNACTMLKTQVARTAQLPNTPYILRDIHFITDHVRTGVQLSDYSADEVADLIASDDFFKFAMLRNPADRLLSAYIEKFVTGRLAPANKHHTKSVVVPVQAKISDAPPDFDRGVTFRQFVRFLEQAPRHTLDPHWRPQSLYLDGIEYDRLFRLDQLDELMDILEDRAQMELTRKPLNVTGSGKGIPRPGAADLYPAEILAEPRIAHASFFDPEIQSTVETVYASDYELFQMTSGI